MDIYIKTPTGEKGPFSMAQIRSMWASGNLTKNDEYRDEGLVEWYPLGDLRSELEPPAAKPGRTAEDLRTQITAASQRQINFEAEKKSGLASAIFNLIIPGAGYMYCGSVGFGFLVLFVAIVAIFVTMGFALYVIVPALVIDGFLAAGRFNRKLAQK